MANYLFLRGNRNKRFFSDIAAELIQKGNQCFLMKFELGELLFKSEIETKYMPFYVSKKEYPITDEELLEMPLFNLTYKEYILKKSVKKSELRMYKRYLFAMDQYIKEKKIDAICTFNGYHWLDQMAQLLARKYGLQMHYFEEGLFRPYTITHDLNGINAEASIPRQPVFYQNIEVDPNRLNQYLFQPENPSLKEALGGQILKVAFVKLVSMFGSLCRLNPKLYDHINFWQALNYFVTKIVFKYKKEDTFEWPTEYVFLPFQMVGDTQILYNSPHIKTMERLLKRTVKAVTQINREEKRNIKIIVKEHPEDISRNNYSQLKRRYKDNGNVIFVKKFNIHSLIKNALAVITINSTVGIEALTQHKRVITLGEALYNIEGITWNCKHPSDLANVLKTSLNEQVNHSLIDKYLYYLRFHYQIEGTLNGCHPATSKNIAERLVAGVEREESIV